MRTMIRSTELGAQDEGLLQGHQPSGQMGPHVTGGRAKDWVSNGPFSLSCCFYPGTLSPRRPPRARPQQRILGPGDGWWTQVPSSCRPGPIFLPGSRSLPPGFGGALSPPSPTSPSVCSTVLKCPFPHCDRLPPGGDEG